MTEVYRVPVTDRDQTRAGLALHLVAASIGVPVRATEGVRPALDGLRARRLAIYLAHIGYGWTIERTAHAFGLSRITTARACSWSEDQRDEPAVDAMMETLEGCLRAIVNGGTGA